MVEKTNSGEQEPIVVPYPRDSSVAPAGRREESC